MQCTSSEGEDVTLGSVVSNERVVLVRESIIESPWNPRPLLFQLRRGCRHGVV